MFLTLITCLISCLATPFASAALVEVGNPIYVLEQPENPELNAPSLRLWEVRPGERNDSQMFSGSRLLFSSSHSMSIVSFGFAGFAINSEAIHPGSFFALEKSGVISKESDGKFTALQGKFKLLESGAETTLAAITAQNEIALLHRNSDFMKAPKAYPLPLDAGEEVIGMQRSTDGESLWLMTSAKKIIEWSMHYHFELRVIDLNLPKTVTLSEKFYIENGKLWMIEGSTLTRLDLNALNAEPTQTADLSDYLSTPGKQIDFSGFHEDGVYLRVDTHYMKFMPSVNSIKLSNRIVSMDFFGERLRPFGCTPVCIIQ